MTETLNELIAKWRERAEFACGSVQHEHAKTYRRCADELSSALAGIARPAQDELSLSAHDHGNCELCDALEVRHAAAEANLRQLVKAEEAYRANERLALRRLSDALTGGNAGTWDDVFEAAEAARPTRDGGTGWQHIETAPKDGTHVLLAYRRKRYFDYWADGEWVALGGWNRKTEQWWSWAGDDDNQPTHWMPLPTPPSSGGTDA